MISEKEIHELVEKHIKELNERNANKSNNSLIPKKAIVMNTTIYGEKLGYKIGKIKIERGKVFAHNRLLERAVFKPNKIMLDNESYYLELKGYGANGKYLFPTHHSEGDLQFKFCIKICQKVLNN